jgi:hypothetical protein
MCWCSIYLCLTKYNREKDKKEGKNRDENNHD